MGRKADISACKKAQITILLEQRQTNRAIPLACGVSTGTVQNIRNKLRNSKTLSPKRKSRCGKKKATSEQDDRILLRNLRRQPLASAKQLKSEWEQHGVIVSTRTVRRRLNKMDCRSVKPRRVPTLTAKMKKKRLEFAKSYKHWSVHDWEKVRFKIFVIL